MLEASQTARTRVLLADDHTLVLEGLSKLLQKEFDLVGTASSGAEAVEMAAALRPDVLLMDISMPVLNGLKATKRLRSMKPDTKILTLTRHTDDGYLRQLITAGANGYVLKQSAPSELINAIRTVGSGNSFLDPAVTQKVMGGYASKSDSLRGENKGDLSARENEILKYIAFGYSNKEIATRIDLSIKTIEAHKANAMKKLGISGRIDIVKYAILQNWLQDD